MRFGLVWDAKVPINQSHALHEEYKKRKLPVHFEVVHGGAAFLDARRNKLVREFFVKHLMAESKH